jgi:hypothetical protein
MVLRQLMSTALQVAEICMSTTSRLQNGAVGLQASFVPSPDAERMTDMSIIGHMRTSTTITLLRMNAHLIKPAKPILKLAPNLKSAIKVKNPASTFAAGV